MLNDRVDDLLLRLSNGCSQFLIQALFRDLEIFRIRRCAFLSLRESLLLPLVDHLYDHNQRLRVIRLDRLFILLLPHLLVLRPWRRNFWDLFDQFSRILFCQAWSQSRVRIRHRNIYRFLFILHRMHPIIQFIVLLPLLIQIQNILYPAHSCNRLADKISNLISHEIIPLLNTDFRFHTSDLCL